MRSPWSRGGRKQDACRFLGRPRHGLLATHGGPSGPVGKWRVLPIVRSTRAFRQALRREDGARPMRRGLLRTGRGPVRDRSTPPDRRGRPVRRRVPAPVEARPRRNFRATFLRGRVGHGRERRPQTRLAFVLRGGLTIVSNHRGHPSPVSDGGLSESAPSRHGERREARLPPHDPREAPRPRRDVPLPRPPPRWGPAHRPDRPLPIRRRDRPTAS